MRFIRRKVVVEDKPIVTFALDSESEIFEIWATGQGIKFMGNSPVIETEEELQQFASGVADAWKEHRGMKPKLIL